MCLSPVLVRRRSRLIVINVVSHSAGTLTSMNNRALPANPNWPKLTHAGMHSMPPVGADAPDPIALPVGDGDVAVRVGPTLDWQAVAFVINSESGDAIRAVRTVQGHMWVERWQSSEIDPSGHRRDGDDWVLIIDLEEAARVSPFTGALIEYVRALHEDDVLLEVQLLNARTVHREYAVLKTIEENAAFQSRNAARASRRNAALGITDSVQRDIAIRMADDWNGTPEQLLAVSAEIARPVALGADEPPPAL